MTELTAEERKTRAEYFRKWRAENRDKVSEYNRRYWAKKTAERKDREEHAETKDKP